MNANVNVCGGVLTMLLISLTIASAEAQDLRVDIRFTDPVDNQTLASVPFSLDPAFPLPPPVEVDLPPEVNAVFFLGGGRTSSSGRTTYVTSDIQTASVPFRDAEYTVMRAFRMELSAEGTVEVLSWESERFSTLSVIDEYTTMNSPLFIEGTDRLSGLPYSYTYRESEVTITAIPEPSTLALGGIVGLAGLVRRRR